MAYSFCRWLTNPSFKFTDGFGISVSNELIIDGSSDTRYAEYNFVVPDLNIDECESLPITTTQCHNGVLATAKLKSTSVPSHITYNIKEQHKFMIQTGISFNNSAGQKGIITGYYLHKEVPFGSIGIDKNGVPNLGGTTDSHSSFITISRE